VEFTKNRFGGNRYFAERILGTKFVIVCRIQAIKMARNSEKAMTTLARWRAAHIDGNKEKERRPYLATGN